MARTKKKTSKKTRVRSGFARRNTSTKRNSSRDNSSSSSASSKRGGQGKQRSSQQHGAPDEQLDRPLKQHVTGEYRLLDSGNMQRLEQFGNYRLVRPAPQAVWQPSMNEGEWRSADATFTRTSEGGGKWAWHDHISRDFEVLYDNLQWQVKLTNFGHVGIFGEQLDNWQWLREKIRTRLKATNGRNLYVLNLFAYTGGSTLACSQAGAHLVHVDAAKSVVDWARKNAELCRLDDRPIRWLVDDAIKFIQREERRGHTYDGIILDPPSFGRGPQGEVFKIERDIHDLLTSCRNLLSKDALFMLYSCHTPGFTPITMENQLRDVLAEQGGTVETGEMTMPNRDDRLLPSGVYARWCADESKVEEK